MNIYKKILLYILASILLLLNVLFVGVSISNQTKESLAEDGLIPQFTIGASEVTLGTNPDVLTTFNNGHSFVYFGTFSNDSNCNFSFTTPQLNFDTSLMSMRFNFSNSNVDNRLSVLNVSLFGYYFADNITDNIYTLNGVNATSLNSYFNDVFITIGKKYDKIRCSIQAAVTSGYVEFAFNDFSIDFFSDFKIAYENGYKDGYDDAKEEFYQSRYEAGKSDGLTEGASGQYSFFALMSAVIETPINAVLGMLDFNFLDINLKSFFLSVFTIALIVMILRFVLAKH